MRPRYPFTAVVGQEPLKLALILSAIDPGIGGVLIHGPRGVAKTTLSRALGALIDGAFVELPLGASEERVSGTLDLGAALRDGRVEFSPGLLARAHEGALYVDEVNLLPDALVDLLLDAAASGQNVVERDGVSHSHPARFVLIGTMNPEEGELRPQLTDRFGLSVSAHAEISLAARAEIITRRLAFEHDPEGFVATYAAEQASLVARCKHARDKLPHISLVGPALARVSAHCHAAHVEGVRADLAMLRAARAHAAWHDRDIITDEDVDAVSEFALSHRRHHRPPPPPPPRTGPGGAPSGGTPTRGGPSTPPSRSASPPSDTSSASPSASGDRGALAPVPVASDAPPTLPDWLFAARKGQGEHRRTGRISRAVARGRQRGPHHAGTTGPIDWFASLARRRPHRAFARADLVHRMRKGPARQLWVLLLDCSTSMLRSGALAAAKGVAQALEARATRAGAHVALITFRGSTAEVAITPHARGAHRLRAIALASGGGGTPLRTALREALSLCSRRPFHRSDVDKRVMLLTDGRTREQIDDVWRTAEGVSLVVIDCERGPVRLGRAQNLAASVGAQTLRIDTLS